ncbi:MAG: urea ABC transporter ATP-binding subunit UrtE [Pikeienuella sp.]|uniref:urea ABC transporter ATP-binding subunit UrtE n=1 Tax=Pikeienuella sp. TaxID=2831957 RepID=UPI00391BD7B5
MLRTEGLTLHYGGAQILHGLDVAAETGRVTCVMGVNGAGKTSLLKAIAGSHRKTGGAVILDGEDISRLSPQARAKKGVGYVPQGRMIFPLLTVQENLETGFGCLPKAERRVPEAMFELFPVLKEMRNRRGGDLSGGQQQQLAIARALITRPKLLLLDEPTEGIQPNIIQQIGRVIAMLRDEGKMAIILVEQYFDFAYGLADRFYAVTRGAVTMEGAKAEVDREKLLSAVSV